MNVTLKKALVKLAHEHPEFRDDLMPLIREAASKTATSPQEWELANKLINTGTKAPPFRKFVTALAGIEDGFKDAKRRSDAMQRVGVGRTEDPTFLMSMVKPAFEDLKLEIEGVIMYFDGNFRDPR